MSLQITNPGVIEKVERLAKATRLSNTAAVERAVDQMLREVEGGQPYDRFKSLLAQLDQIPDQADTTDPLPWDASGLPQ